MNDRLITRIHIANICLVLVIVFLVGFMEYDLNRRDAETNAAYAPVGNEYDAFVQEDEDWLKTLEDYHAN